MKRDNMIEFDDPQSPSVQEWLNKNKWDPAAIKAKLTKGMKSLKARRNEK